MLRSDARGRLMFWCFELEIYYLLIKSVVWHICHKAMFRVAQRTVWPRRYLGRDWLIWSSEFNSLNVRWSPQTVVPALKEASWVCRTWGLFFSYLSFFLFLVWGSLIFLGWVLTLKLWTVWQTNYYVVYWYFTNIISIFNINYWWSWDILEI